MNTQRHLALLLLPLLAASCATAGPSLPAAGGAPQAAAAPSLLGAVEASLGADTSNVASLAFAQPKGEYSLQANPTVHRWVPADIVEYVVSFQKQLDATTFDVANASTVTVRVKGPNAKTTAVFTKVPWGATYRAFVTAKGNVGGNVPAGYQLLIPNATLVVLNDVAATADFDFTTTQDAPSQVTRAVQVVFNKVAFSGTGSVTFTAPAEGTYANPVGDIQATATAVAS